MKWLLALLLLLAGPTSAWAHGLEAEATVSGGSVVFKLTFSDGTPAVGATVTAYRLGSSRTVVAEGKTDAKGVFRFEHGAGPGRFKIVAVEVGGHRATVEVGVTETGEAAPVASNTAHGHDHDDHNAGSPIAVVIGLLVIALLGGVMMVAQRKGQA